MHAGSAGEEFLSITDSLTWFFFWWKQLVAPEIMLWFFILKCNYIFLLPWLLIHDVFIVIFVPSSPSTPPPGRSLEENWLQDAVPQQFQLIQAWAAAVLPLLCPVAWSAPFAAGALWLTPGAERYVLSILTGRSSLLHIAAFQHQ